MTVLLPPQAPHPSPVSAAYTRLGEVFPRLTVTEGAPLSGGGWFRSAELATDPDALDAFLAWDTEQVERRYGQPVRPDVAATFSLHRYAWPACLLITLPWFLYRRVPRLPVENVSLQGAEGRMTVRVEEFACLPDDPAAALPGARVVADEEALRAEVRASVAEHLEPLLASFRPRMRRGPQALWSMATDEIVESLWYVGHLLDEESRAMAELSALLPGATAPYRKGAAFRELTGPRGETLVTRDRASCCLFYTVRPQDTCVSCPRTRDDERIARLSSARTD